VNEPVKLGYPNDIQWKQKQVKDKHRIQAGEVSVSDESEIAAQCDIPQWKHRFHVKRHEIET
jgi:hypothetical protein